MPKTALSFTGLVLGLLFTFSAPAEVRRAPLPNTYYVLERVGQTRTFDEIRLDSRGWPERVARKTFANTHDFRNDPLARLYSRSARIVPSEVAASATLEFRDPETTPLWNATETWNAQWETRYAAWIEKNIHKNFFIEAQQPSDCADLAYAARWIFARENHLPIANHLTGSGKVFSERSVKTEWMRLPTNPAGDWKKDRRFRAALDYLLSVTYTHTLFGDSYPIALNATAFTAGVHHLSLDGTSGHTLLVHRTDYENPESLPFLVLYSTLPIAIRELAEQAYFYTDAPKPTSGGFLRLRWPAATNGNYRLIAREAMPGFSLEQYAPELMEGQSSFGIAVMKKLKPHFSLRGAVLAAIQGLRETIAARVAIVNDGYAVCSARPCIPGSADYENWSTPHRDQRLVDQFELVNLLPSLGGDQLSVLSSLVSEELRKTVIRLDGYEISANLVLMMFRRKLHSSDPNVRPALRWAVTPEAIIELTRERFLAARAQREQFLRETPNTCVGSTRPDCAPGGEAFKRENSFAIDGTMKNLAELNETYCSAVGPADPKCTAIASLMATTEVSTGNRNRPLKEALDFSTFYNSDPRVSPAVRNGHPGTLSRIELTQAYEFRATATRAFAKDRETFRGHLYRRENSRWTEEKAANAEWLDVEWTTGTTLISERTGIVRVMADHSRSLPYSGLSERPVEALLVEAVAGISPRIFVRTKTECRLLEIGRNRAWVLLASKPCSERNVQIADLERRFALVAYGANQPRWQMIDLQAVAPKFIDVPGTVSLNETLPPALFPRGLYLPITVTKSNTPDAEIAPRTVFFDRVTGKLSFVEVQGGFSPGQILHIAKDEKTAYFQTEVRTNNSVSEAVYLGELASTPDGRVSFRQDHFVATNFYRTSDGILMMGTPAGFERYAIRPNDGKLEKLETLNEEMWIRHYRSGWVFAQLGNETSQMRALRNPALNFKAGIIGMPVQADVSNRELPRYLISGVTSGEQLLLSDLRHPEKFSLLSGALFGDAAYSEPVFADHYGLLQQLDVKHGVIVNVGSRIFWLAE